jgi:hypothetical protein
VLLAIGRNPVAGQETFGWRRRSVILLDDLGAFSHLGLQLETRLKVIHI